MGIWSSIGSALTGSLVKEVGKVIDNLVTTKEEREKIKLELFRLEQEFALREKEHLAKIVELTEPKSVDTPRFINGIRAFVRPGITLIGFSVYQSMLVWLVYTGKMDVAMFVAQLGGLVGTTLGFYFSARGYEKTE